MEKVVCFFFGNSSNFRFSNNTSFEEYKEFNEKLLELKEKNNADSLVFSLVTNDSYEDVRDTKYLLKEFFDPSIKFGRNFFEDGYIENWSVGLQFGGKSGSVIDYLAKANSEYEIEHIYYFDDSDVSREIVSYFITDAKLDDYYTYVSLENVDTLKDTNKLLSSVIGSKEMVKK